MLSCTGVRAGAYARVCGRIARIMRHVFSCAGCATGSFSCVLQGFWWHNRVTIVSQACAKKGLWLCLALWCGRFVALPMV